MDWLGWNDHSWILQDINQVGVNQYKQAEWGISTSLLDILRPQ